LNFALNLEVASGVAQLTTIPLSTQNIGASVPFTAILTEPSSFRLSETLHAEAFVQLAAHALGGSLQGSVVLSAIAFSVNDSDAASTKPRHEATLLLYAILIVPSVLICEHPRSN